MRMDELKVKRVGRAGHEGHTTQRRFYAGLLGASPLGTAQDLEAGGYHGPAGRLYAWHGCKEAAGRCAVACAGKGYRVDAAAIYLTAGMLQEALECAQNCAGKDAFLAAKLFLEHAQTWAAEMCAKHYLEGKGTTAVPMEEREILFRIFSKVGDPTMANLFAPTNSKPKLVGR